jgi:hypothetical protein
MKIINSKKELLKHVEHDHRPYDVDANWIIQEMDYEYPVFIEFMGSTMKGTAYKVRDKKCIEEFKKLLF